MKIALCPDPTADALVRLIGHPILRQVESVQIFAASILDEESPIAGPNTRKALREAGFFQHLKEQGIPLGVEVGAIKGGDGADHQPNCSGETFINQISSVHRSLGGYLDAVWLDEPLNVLNVPTNNWKTGHCFGRGELHKISQNVAKVVAHAHALGIKAYLVESFPNMGWTEPMQPYLEMMNDYLVDVLHDRPIDRFVLDVSFQEIDDEAPKFWWPPTERKRRRRYYQQIDHTLHAMFDTVKAMVPEVWVINGSPVMPDYPATDDGFVASAREQRRRLPFTPDGWNVESWEKKDYPTIDALARVVAEVRPQT